MAHAQLPVVDSGFGATARRDAWWVQPLVVFVVLGSFITYATWAAFQGRFYTYGPYISPFYSPELFGDSPHRLFGPKPSWWPGFMPFSAALLVLPVPGLFRFTCYYYRGAYYKAFWADPPSCAVGEPRKSYLGENAFPLILQNLHRYVLYFALPVLLFLWKDVYEALWFTDVAGATHFGIGVGTIVLAANTVLLSGYTLGCHSLRHLIGGYRDQLSSSPVRSNCYQACSAFNRAHMRWAWFSLFSVAFSDVYVRMCAMGVWRDWRIL